MKKIFLSLILGSMLISCAAKQVEVAPAPVIEKVDYSVVIEGLESEYYPSVSEALKNISTFDSQSVLLSREGALEIKGTFVDNKEVAENVREAMTNLFQTLSKTIEVQVLKNSIRIEVTNY